MPQSPSSFIRVGFAITIFRLAYVFSFAEGRRQYLRCGDFRNSENSMQSAKEVMVDIITHQPDDSSYDEILRELA